MFFFYHISRFAYCEFRLLNISKSFRKHIVRSANVVKFLVCFEIVSVMKRFIENAVPIHLQRNLTPEMYSKRIEGSCERSAIFQKLFPKTFYFLRLKRSEHYFRVNKAS